MTPAALERSRRMLLGSRDTPSAISQADFEAHLEAHRLLEAHLERSKRRSDPVRLSGHGWTVRGRGEYLLVMAGLALVAFWLWLIQ